MAASLPIIAGESGLARYLQEIKKFPMLEPQEEFMLRRTLAVVGATTAMLSLSASLAFAGNPAGTGQPWWTSQCLTCGTTACAGTWR